MHSGVVQDVLGTWDVGNDGKLYGMPRFKGSRERLQEPGPGEVCLVSYYVRVKYSALSVCTDSAGLFTLYKAPF